MDSASQGKNRSPVHSNIREPRLPGSDDRFELAFEHFIRALGSNAFQRRLAQPRPQSLGCVELNALCRKRFRIAPDEERIVIAPTQLRRQQRCGHDRHATRCGFVDLMGNSGGVSSRRNEHTHGIVESGKIRKIASPFYPRLSKRADSFGFVDSGYRECRFAAQPRLDSWKDFLQKPDDRITVWACLFMNGADE